MTRQEIADKIRSILSDDFRVRPELITSDATFRGTLGLDSLDVVDFIMLLQKDFGFKSSLESYRELHTFDRLVDFVSQALNPSSLKS